MIPIYTWGHWAQRVSDSTPLLISEVDIGGSLRTGILSDIFHDGREKCQSWKSALAGVGWGGSEGKA